MDNGIGIPVNDFKNVFDKGYRGINAKELENASGITTSFKFPKYK